MKHVILDTNFILHCLEFKVDFMQELERILEERFDVSVMDRTLQELEGKKNSKLALALLRKLDIKLIKSPEGVKDVDTALFILDAPGMVIATQDRALKERLKKRGVEVITIRQKKYLIMV